MTIGERIAQCRKNILGIKQIELAEMCGISRVTLSQYENDQRDPTLFNAMCLADIFGVSLDYLAKGKVTTNE